MARKRTGALSFYHELIWYDMEWGRSVSLPAFREQLSVTALNVDDHRDLEEHDQFFAGHIITADDDEIWPGLLQAHPEQPLEKWWWHLEAIRRWEYPAELLPEHLSRVYDAEK